jgi:DNA (cytosine-5)-methyltransferase 1
MGYHRAGFDVVGVDIKPQPHYPFRLIQGDALSFLATRGHVGRWDAVHASPPCQRYSDLAHRNGNASEHPDLIGPTRELLEATGLPYIIENVEGAPLRDPIVICGTWCELSVDGYRLRRHRLFEATFDLLTPTGPYCACSEDARPVIDVSGGGPTHAPRLDGGGGRTYKGTVAQKRIAMGIDWMTGSEIVEAVPPAYTEFVGERLFTHLRIAEFVRFTNA